MIASALDVDAMPDAIRQVIDRWAIVSPDRIFLVDPESGQTITYLELQRQVRAVAAFLKERGICSGSSVAFALGNSTQSAITILGILYGDYVATAINLVAGSSVISYVLEHSEAQFVFADEAGMKALENSLEEVAFIPVDTITPEEIASQPLPEISHSANSNGGLLMYTSGTTGRPKGVVHSQSSLLAGGGNTALAHRLDVNDCGLCVLPLYHINGLCVTLMGALVSGGTLVMPNRFSVSSFWQTIIDTNCTWFSVVPTQISYLLHEKSEAPSLDELKHVRFGRSASAPLSPDVQKAFEEKFNIPVIETMGLTETAAQILSNPLPPGTRKIGSPGIAYGNEVMIGDGEQIEMPRGEEGEVLVRGANVMSHYLKNDEATRQSLTSDGWLRTGDLGRMDEDGYVYITGRLKELIIKGGENIAPREIDEALYSHHAVIEAAAFAMPCPNYGERVEAAVKLDPASGISQEELIKLCHTRLGKFKSPDCIHILDELPKGPSGKIQRMKLVELLAK